MLDKILQTFQANNAISTSESPDTNIQNSVDILFFGLR